VRLPAGDVALDGVCTKMGRHDYEMHSNGPVFSQAKWCSLRHLLSFKGSATG
jgi:hypothetical protein